MLCSECICILMNLIMFQSNVLYVKNLSFETTEESLKKQLTELVKHGKILSVKVKLLFIADR